METIANLADKFENNTELQAYCKKQTEALHQAKDIILKLSQEIKQLKEQLSLSSSSGTEIVIKSTEQDICEIQIEKLREVAFERQLTLEETKRLDLLVKNLLLSKGAYKDIKPDYRTIPKGLTPEKLLQLASTSLGEV